MELTVILLIVLIALVGVTICLSIPERVWGLLSLLVFALPLSLRLHFLGSCVLIDIVLLDRSKSVGWEIKPGCCLSVRASRLCWALWVESRPGPASPRLPAPATPLSRRPHPPPPPPPPPRLRCRSSMGFSSPLRHRPGKVLPTGCRTDPQPPSTPPTPQASPPQATPTTAPTTPVVGIYQHQHRHRWEPDGASPGMGGGTVGGGRGRGRGTPSN